VREAIERARSGAGDQTCHDLVRDSCGTIDGAADLSTNPKHFDSFGK
jgi:hypothetical protein